MFMLCDRNTRTGQSIISNQLPWLFFINHHLTSTLRFDSFSSASATGTFVNPYRDTSAEPAPGRIKYMISTRAVQSCESPPAGQSWHKGKMTKTDWLMRFRRCRSIDTLETVYEHLKYKGDSKEEFAINSAYDHRKAELTMGKLFDRVPPHVWKFVKWETAWSSSKILPVTDGANTNSLCARRQLNKPQAR